MFSDHVGGAGGGEIPPPRLLPYRIEQPIYLSESLPQTLRRLRYFFPRNPAPFKSSIVF